MERIAVHRNEYSAERERSRRGVVHRLGSRPPSLLAYVVSDSAYFLISDCVVDLSTDSGTESD